MTEQTKTWRLDPPACDCDKLCKNPEHDRPEWRLVHGAEVVTAILGQRHADVVKAVNTGDLKSPGRRPLRVRFPPSA